MSEKNIDDYEKENMQDSLIFFLNIDRRLKKKNVYLRYEQIQKEVRTAFEFAWLLKQNDIDAKDNYIEVLKEELHDLKSQYVYSQND